METIIKTAHVKVMLSYNYSHFESSLSIENEGGLTIKDVDNARKMCQRLSDKAVDQYKTAQNELSKRNNSQFEKDNFKANAERALKVPELDRTVGQLAIIKQYQQDDWQRQFNHDTYDYDDDDRYEF